MDLPGEDEKNRIDFNFYLRNDGWHSYSHSSHDTGTSDPACRSHSGSRGRNKYQTPDPTPPEPEKRNALLPGNLSRRLRQHGRAAYSGPSYHAGKNPTTPTFSP